MTLLAIFGINNGGLNLAVKLLLLLLVVFWIALVYWTYSDARRRVEDPMLIGCATAASLFPFIGTVVYLIVRPPEYLEDVRERELEIAAAEARVAGIEHLACHYCSYEIEKAFLRCPSCLRRLKEPCATCGKPLDPRWSLCPYCEAEVGQAQSPPRQRPRRRERPPAAAAAPAASAAPQRSASPAAPGAPQRSASPGAPQRSASPARNSASPRAGDAPPQRSAPPAGNSASPRSDEAPPQRTDDSRAAPRPARPAEGRPRSPAPGSDRSERPPTRRARP